MSNPFPGMNPYFEQDGFWPNAHTRCLTYLSDQLNEQLPNTFAATVEERVYVVGDEREFVADFAVARATNDRLPQTMTAVATVGKPVVTLPRILQLEPVEIRERYIEIVTTRARRQVIAVIKLLSPTNKSGLGRSVYQRKQRKLLQSDVHFLEIDLLRGGNHTLAIPLSRLRRIANWDYLACLHRAGQRDRVAFWDMLLREPLPILQLPLSADVPDVLLNLHEAWQTVYERGAFDRLIDYDESLHPPLSAENQTWLDALLHQKLLRK